MFEDLLYVDWVTMVAVLANFIILFLILKYLLYGRIKKVLDARRDEVESIYDEAHRINEEAVLLKAEYEEKLSNAKETANEIVKTATSRGQSRFDELVSDAQEKSTTMVKRAEEQIEQDKKKAVNQIKNEITELAIGAASRVISKEMSGADHERLIDFIENAGEVEWQN